MADSTQRSRARDDDPPVRIETPDFVHRESPEARDALDCYLQPGAERSLTELALRLDRNWTNSGWKPPSLSTLKNWSRWHSWQARAEQYDAEVADQARQQRVKWEAKVKAARHQARLDRAQDMNDAIHAILHEEGDIEDPVTGETRSGSVLKDAEELKPSTVQMVIALSKEAREIERADLGVGPVVEETATRGTGIIQTREEMLQVYDNIDRMVKMFQATYDDEAAIEGEYQEEDQMDDTQWVAGAWDVDDPEAADE